MENENAEVTPGAPEGETPVAGETAPDSSLENEGDTPEGEEPEGENRPDQLIERQAPAPAVVPEGTPAGSPGVDDLAEVPGETPRERALRAEVTRLKRGQRQTMGQELLGNQPATPTPAPATPALSPEKKAVLDKYKPEEVGALKEVFEALAEDMGFVKKDQLSTQTYIQTANDVLDTFLEKHPEYTKDSVLYDAFKEEYKQYVQPSNPKDLAKIFEKVHRDVFGIQPAGGLSRVNAQRERVSAASHGAASSPPAPQRQRSAVAPGTIRTDMLKGFSAEQIAEIEAGG